MLLFKCLNGTGPTYIGSLFLTLILKLTTILSLIHYKSYGTVCPHKCVFQVTLMTSKVNCTIAAFYGTRLTECMIVAF